MKKGKIFSKKSIIIVSAVAIIALAVGLSVTYPSRHLLSDSKAVKVLLDNLKNANSQYNQKGYESSFKIKYSVKSEKDNDLEKDNIDLSYEGEGSVTLSFKLEDDKKVDKNMSVSSMIGDGEGFIKGTQKEVFKYYNARIDKTENNKENVTNEDYKTNNEFAIKVDDRYLYAVNDSVYEDNINSKKEQKSFAGQIDKKVFIDNESNNRIDETMVRLIYMDTWTYINEISKLSNDILTKMDLDDNKTVNDFVRTNKVKVEEESDKTIITFELDTNRILSVVTGEEHTGTPIIKGYMEVDTETGDMIYFKYDLTDYFLSVLNEKAVNKAKFEAKVDEFIVEGRGVQKEFDEIKLDKEFVEYNKETIDGFIKDFSDNIISFYDFDE